jgi:dTDP-4-dehydrorhamnose 3,5-epimerase-like enzyme
VVISPTTFDHASGPIPGQAGEHRGVIGGIHFADVPPGQTKYVVRVGSAVLDVVVDLKARSPSFQALAKLFS